MRDGFPTIIFSVIVIALMTINGYVFYELIEFKKAVLVNATNEFSDDFKFMKNFADRNIEVYTLVSSVLVGVVTFVIGFGFKFDFDRRIKGLTAQFESLKHDHERSELIHQEKLNSFFPLINNRFGDVFSHLSSTMESQDFDVSVYLRINALVHWFEMYRNDSTPNEDLMSVSNSLLLNLAKRTVELSKRSLDVRDDGLLDRLISTSPKAVKQNAIMFVGAYLSRLNELSKQ